MTGPLEPLHLSMVRVLYDEDAIQARVCELAHEIAYTHSDVDALVLLGILDGAMPFVADLLRYLPPDLQERTEYYFTKASSYRGVTQGPLTTAGVPNCEGESVVIVDDICDTGFTLQAVEAQVQSTEPDAVRIAVMLNKQARRVVPELCLDYVGFEVEDSFMIGYGLDHNDHYRALRFIGALPL